MEGEGFFKDLYKLAEEMQLSISPEKATLNYDFREQGMGDWESDRSLSQYKNIEVIIEETTIRAKMKKSFGVYTLTFSFDDPPTPAQECIAEALVVTMRYFSDDQTSDGDEVHTGAELLKKAAEGEGYFRYKGHYFNTTIESDQYKLFIDTPWN